MADKNNKTAKNSVVKRIFNFISGQNTKDVQPQKQVRFFEGARQSRLTEGFGFSGSGMTIDRQIYGSIVLLRDRARDLHLNNDYVHKYVDLMSNNIVGPNGFNLKVQGYMYNPTTKKLVLDNDNNLIVKYAFQDWCEREYCEITGKYSFVSLCKLLVESVVRDGEALVMKLRDKQLNKYGFTLQILDIDRLDHTLSAELSNGNVIKMGVEMNKFGRPVAYHIKKYKNNDIDYMQNPVTTEHIRVDANDIIHVYKNVRAEQTRGFTWLHSVLINLKMLDAYQESALVAARTGAAKMGFFTSTKTNSDASDIADSEDEAGNLMMNAEPGAFGVLPEGYDFKSFTPDYPAGNYAVFVKAILRSISSGLNISYNNLASDLEGVNYSSMRAGANEERDMYSGVQNWFMEMFLKNVFRDWLKTALLNKAIKTPDGKIIPSTDIEKYSSHVWIGRKWGYVDPAKDIAGKIAGINAGLFTRGEVIAELGGDVQDKFEELAIENEIAKSLGLNLANVDSIYVTQQMEEAIVADNESSNFGNTSKDEEEPTDEKA